MGCKQSKVKDGDGGGVGGGEKGKVSFIRRTASLHHSLSPPPQHSTSTPRQYSRTTSFYPQNQPFYQHSASRRGSTTVAGNQSPFTSALHPTKSMHHYVVQSAPGAGGLSNYSQGGWSHTSNEADNEAEEDDGAYLLEGEHGSEDDDEFPVEESNSNAVADSALEEDWENPTFEVAAFCWDPVPFLPPRQDHDFSVDALEDEQAQLRILTLKEETRYELQLNFRPEPATSCSRCSKCRLCLVHTVLCHRDGTPHVYDGTPKDHCTMDLGPQALQSWLLLPGVQGPRPRLAPYTITLAALSTVLLRMQCPMTLQLSLFLLLRLHMSVQLLSGQASEVENHFFPQVATLRKGSAPQGRVREMGTACWQVPDSQDQQQRMFDDLGGSKETTEAKDDAGAGYCQFDYGELYCSDILISVVPLSSKKKEDEEHEGERPCEGDFPLFLGGTVKVSLISSSAIREPPTYPPSGSDGRDKEYRSELPTATSFAPTGSAKSPGLKVRHVLHPGLRGLFKQMHRCRKNTIAMYQQCEPGASPISPSAQQLVIPWDFWLNLGALPATEYLEDGNFQVQVGRLLVLVCQLHRPQKRILVREGG